MMGVDPDGTRLSVLAARAQIAKQTATALVDKLERAGYVERVPDPTDGRARLVRMTSRAIAAIPLARAEEDRIEQEWRAHLGPKAHGPAPRGPRAPCVRSPTPTSEPEPRTACCATMRAWTSPRAPTTPCGRCSRSRRRRREAAGPLSVETLAQRQDLPRKFLEAIVADLRGAGLVVSTRGARGGYTLARPASEVSLGDVFRAVDGPLAEVRGLRPARDELRGRGRSTCRPCGSPCARALREVLDGTSLAAVPQR